MPPPPDEFHPGDPPPQPADAAGSTRADDDEEPGPDDVAVLPIEDCLDLHPFQPRDILSVTEEYLRACHSRGLREVRIVHGKGTGFQRDRVQRLLGTLDFVAGFHDAPPERGHWGATVVYMKEPPPGGE